MPAPPTPAEQCISVPNMPNGQKALPLWPDRDPNLHRVGIYEFEIEATKLKKILCDAALPRREAPSVIIEVSSSALKIISQTKDASFVISPSVPLWQGATIGSAPIRFEVERELMMNIGRNFKYQLAFTFDMNEASLSWIEKGGSGSYSIEARWLPPQEPDADLRSLAELGPEMFESGIEYVSTLSGRKSPPDFPYEGVRIEGGSILGGYFTGYSRYRCPFMPEDLAFNVPRNHIANAQALFRRMAGTVTILELASRIHARACNIEGSWIRMDTRCKVPDHLFELPPLQTVRVATTLLQQETYFMEGVLQERALRTERVEPLVLLVAIENRGDYGRVVLSASSKVGMGTTRILGGMVVSSGLDKRERWDLTINARDLRDTALATKSIYTILGVTDRGLLIQSDESTDEFKTVLLGSERQ